MSLGLDEQLMAPNPSAIIWPALTLQQQQPSVPDHAQQEDTTLIQPVTATSASLVPQLVTSSPPRTEQPKTMAATQTRTTLTPSPIMSSQLLASPGSSPNSTQVSFPKIKFQLFRNKPEPQTAFVTF